MGELKKTCPSCGRSLPATREFFGYHISTQDHMRKICRVCYSKAKKKSEDTIQLCQYNHGVECDCHDYKQCLNCGWSPDGHRARLNGFTSGTVVQCEIGRNGSVISKKAVIRLSKLTEKDAEKIAINTMDGFSVSVPRKNVEEIFKKWSVESERN